MIAVLDPQQMRGSEVEEIRQSIATAREAQRDWARLTIADRAARIGRLRPLLANFATELAQVTAQIHGRPVAEKMVSEVLPLLEAVRFLARNAPCILREKHFGSARRPLWLQGSSFVVERRPFGVVLIVGPANYPLFIPAVQMLHALVAGNSVVIKPASDASSPLIFLVEQLMRRSDISPDLVQILPEAIEAASDAVRCGVDKAIFTGSSENGRLFLRELAKKNTPSVMELSGADAVYVRADADVSLAAKAIAFGTRLNAGHTCMAPHAIVVHQSVAQPLRDALRDLAVEADPLFEVQNDAEALEVSSFDEHGLGAAIFSRDESAARAFARQLTTGFATINDIIVPTADPRFPFGGVRRSGFGVTRGGEGLLEMTYPQSVAIRRTRFLPHLDEPQETDAELFASFIALAHGRGVRRRFDALRRVITAARVRRKRKAPAV